MDRYNFNIIEEKFDVIVGHFSIYTISSREKRLKGLLSLKALMKPQGILILVNPSIKYDRDLIIKESIRLLRKRYGLTVSLIRQVLIYPFTKFMGLRFIQRQLKVREWKAYTQDELLFDEKYKLTIAVMGCRVNGPGETDDADLGLWCGPTRVNLKKGTEALGSFSYEEILGQLKKEIDQMIQEKFSLSL